MSIPVIISLNSDSLQRVLVLNEASSEATSPLDRPELEEIVAESRYACGIGAPLDAFLIVMDQNAIYESVNFAWFKERRKRFLYIDRIVIAEKARGSGLGRALYNDLFNFARANGYDRVCCEVNLDPPNPVSDGFHKALDFEEVGRAVINDGKKTVRYYEWMA